VVGLERRAGFQPAPSYIRIDRHEIVGHSLEEPLRSR
jgi:hypothetical protein